jgi:ABC-type sugar transport system substrate-binding protein
MTHSFLILNSFVSLHIVNHEFYNAMRDARDSVALQVGDFTSKFSPTVDPTAQLKIILDIIGLGFALVAAPTWSSCTFTSRGLRRRLPPRH